MHTPKKAKYPKYMYKRHRVFYISELDFHIHVYLNLLHITKLIISYIRMYLQTDISNFPSYLEGDKIQIASVQVSCFHGDKKSISYFVRKSDVRTYLHTDNFRFSLISRKLDEIF